MTRELADPGDKRKLGLIINPIAGIGGRVGLKGSDGAATQRQALALGAVPESSTRALRALEMLKVPRDGLTILTYPGAMGEEAVRAGGFEPTVVGSIRRGSTTATDTRDAAQKMLQEGVALLLFAGGDGTARDIYQAVGDRSPVLGIPAGVKIHSAVFATSPANAGVLADLFLQGRATDLREAEVMDIDEDAVRRGIVSAKLYGYLRIPYRGGLVQSLKAASGPGEAAAMDAIALDVVDHMDAECLYIIGPGTTTRAIMSALGLDKTLIGVDVVKNGELDSADVNEKRLIELVERHTAKVIVTPIGGQGYIFGRGNQQISHRVIARVGRENIIVVATATKMYALRGRPLLVDTGARAVDEMLAGYVRVITGYNEEMIYRVA